MSDSKRVTIYDVAAAAGVSVATVTRALNNKKDISEKTRKKVLETADLIGFKITNSAQRLRQKTIKISVMLQAPVMSHLSELYNGVKAAAENLRNYNVEVIVYLSRFIDVGDNTQAHECFDKILNDKPDCLLCCGVSDFDDEVLKYRYNELEQRGILTFALTFGFLKSKTFILTDNRKAGSLAAELLSFTCKNKKVAVLTGEQGYKIHDDAVSGFYDYNSNFSEIHLLKHRDNEMLIQKQIDELFTNAPDIAGMYLSTASSDYICDILEKYDKNRKIHIVATDLTEKTKKFLKEGVIDAIIYQNPYQQAYSAVDMAYHYMLGEVEDGTYLYRPQLVFRSDCDSDFKTSLVKEKR